MTIFQYSTQPAKMPLNVLFSVAYCYQIKLAQCEPTVLSSHKQIIFKKQRNFKEES